MKKSNIFLFIAICLAICLPIPGRFGYGIIVALSMNFYMLLICLVGKLIDKIKLTSLRPVCILFTLVCSAVFFRQLVIIFSPIIALSLGLLLYFPILGVLMICDCLEKDEFSLKKSLSTNMIMSGKISIFILIFFLVRDIAGYGTITIPIPSGLFKIYLPQILNFSPSVFFATISGGLVLAGIFLALMTLVHRKCNIISRSSELQEELTNAD
ncbi:MAG: hypothetical protein J6B32_02610 [Spirochaetaceae bacterium]|nr:hypothetical protein [Spirochaetaceae bacterium]